MSLRAHLSISIPIWVIRFNTVLIGLLGIGSFGYAGDFHPVLAQECREMSWRLEGGSFLEGQILVPRVNLPERLQVPDGYGYRAYLIWSGEVNEVDDGVRQITLSQEDVVTEIRSEHFWTERATGFLYTAVAEVTEVFQESKGPLGLSGIRSDPVDYTGTGGYSQAGWALVQMVCQEGSAERKMAFFAGAEAVPPGEPRHVELWKEKEEVRLVRLGTVGGHGIEGNGGGNLLNGLAITGGDDWRGNSGELWDVQVHTLPENDPRKSWILSFDPVLEWVFPCCIVAEFLLSNR